MKIQNALVSNILDRSQQYFAHVTTVTLSWRVQNIVVIGGVYFTLECFEFSSNFEFERNMLSGTAPRNPYLKQWRPSLLRYICVTRFRWVNMREARKLYFYGAVISWFAYISAKNWWIWISLGTHILNISMKLIHCLYAGSSKLNASSSLVYC